MKLTEEKKALVLTLREEFGAIATRKQIVEFVGENGLALPRWIFNNKEFRAGRAQYNLDAILGTAGGVVGTPAVETGVGTGTTGGSVAGGIGGIGV